MSTASSILQALLHGFSQSTRLIRLTTPMGAHTMLAECVRGEEGVSNGYKFTISVLSTDAQIKLSTLIGQPALLQLMTAHSRDELRPFHGHITAIEHSGANGGFARYQITLGPWLDFSRLGRDSRVFQDKTVFDILNAIFEEYQGKGRLVPAWRYDIVDREAYPRRSLTTQYQESNFAFVERLMVEEGLFYFFEHEGDADSPSLGRHTMVIANHNGAFKPNQQERIDFTQSGAVMKVDGIDRWRTELKHETTGIQLSSWDYRTVNSRSVSATEAAEPQMRSRDSLAPYAYESRQLGQRLVDFQMQGMTARREIHVAAGTVRTLAPGTTFTLNGHAQINAVEGDDRHAFLILRTVHLMHNNLSAELNGQVIAALKPAALSLAIEEEASSSLHAIGNKIGERPLYRNCIDAIRLSIPYRTSAFDMEARARFQRPTIRGQQTAIVVGPAGSSVHTDRDHRVKVQFHWQRGEQSHSRLPHPCEASHTGAPGDDTAGTWVRVATPLAPVAGSNWGSHALPRVGQEVLVDFLEGDIDCPVVIGALYNGKGNLDAQHNGVAQGGGSSTGNAPAWFPGDSAAHAHPAVLSGIKTQSMGASQVGSGAYSQLLFDDSPGQSRLSLQRHAAAHQGNDELNLGSLRHQSDNALLMRTGFGAELKTDAGAALRAGEGMLLSTYERGSSTGAQLDAREALAQTQNSIGLQQSLATTAQQHHAKLEKEPEPDKLPAVMHMADSIAVMENTEPGISGSDAGGAGVAPAFSQAHLQLCSPVGITAVTPADVIVIAGKSSSIIAGQDINFVAQASTSHVVLSGASLFTDGRVTDSAKPNQEKGMSLHAANGKVCVHSHAGALSATADKSVGFVSVTSSVAIKAPNKYVLLRNR